MTASNLLPEGLELVATGRNAEVYEFTSDQGDLVKVWVDHQQGRLHFASIGLPEVPFDTVQWLLDRGRYLAAPAIRATGGSDDAPRR